MEEGYYQTEPGKGIFHIHDNEGRYLVVSLLMRGKDIKTEDGYTLAPSSGWKIQYTDTHEQVNDDGNLAQAYNFEVRTKGGIPV